MMVSRCAVRRFFIRMGMHNRDPVFNVDVGK